jgi:ubiquinone/menaquinone biosynthesis C-methylase UbiE/uncharacterized protein YbaR (Trm112 family)
MLLSLVERLMCPACSTQGHPMQAHVFAPGEDGHMGDGVLSCPACGTWYPVEDGLLELVVPALLDKQDDARFRARFASQLAALNLAPADAAPAAESDDFEAQRKQRELFDWYAENPELDYSSFQNTAFWTAVDKVTFGRWKTMIKPGSWLLDVGCANGRSAFPIVRHGSVTVIGFDISKKLVRQAISIAKASGAAGRTTFFVADGSQLPLRNDSFDHVLIYGVLHHLPNPGRACRDVLRILKPGGVYFGSENNKSMFRKLFDLLMKVAPLWKEEAGEEPLISREMLDRWVDGVPIRFRCSTSVFLPPHVFNLLGKKGAQMFLPLSDMAGHLLPGLRNQGGLIVFEMEKLDSGIVPGAPAAERRVPAPSPA